MAFDAFLKLNDWGESSDDKHKGWIEIISFDWGLSQGYGSSGISARGGQTTGKADIEDFSFTKNLDKASPKLFQACASGEHVPEATLELCEATGNKSKYLEYKFSDVAVASLQVSGSGQGSDGMPSEQVSLRFGKVVVNYIEHDNKGKAKGNIQAGWDLAKNVKV